MKKLVLIIAAGLLAGLVAVPAMARGRHQGAAVRPAKVANGQEHGKFASMDSNKDGKISFDEFKAWHEAKKAARQSSGAHHGNRHVKQAGKKAGKHLTLQERFDRRDLNHDGFISKKEWKQTKRHHEKHGKKS